MTPTLENIQLKKGAHDSPGHGFCAMEAAAYIAGEPHSAYPACVPPVLATFMREWNDAVEDGFRQKLKPFIPRMIGLADDGKDEARRRWLATDWLVRVYAPAWLDLAGLTQHAAAMRAADVIHDSTSAERVQPALAAARATVRAIARYATAGSIVGAATEAAAGAAARAIARSTGCAAEDIAWQAATVAIASLQPTVESLQASALELLDRMITEVAA